MHARPVDNASTETAYLGLLCGMRLTESARRHGVAEADIWHALRHPIRNYPDQGVHELTLVIGSARDGSILEVGIVEDEDETRVVHAMPVRPKYWH